MTLIALCLPCAVSHAERDNKTYNRFGDQYHRSWTVREGVPPGLWQTKQTTDGFLWLASETGLYRFDGIAFTKYLPPVGQALLKDGPVSAMAPTADGGLWIAYRFGGASLIRAGVVINYPADQNFSETVFALAQDRQGQMWGATVTGLVRFDGKRWSRVDASWGVRVTRVTHLRIMSNGELWFDDGKDYYALPPSGRQFRRTGLPAGKLDITGADTGWLALDDEGLFPVARAPDGTWAIGKRLLRQNISSIMHTPDGSLWFGSHEGIWRIRSIGSYATKPLKARALESLQKADGLSADFVYSLTVDREGSVWAVTPNGLDQFRKTALTNVTMPPDMQLPFLIDEGTSVMVGSGFHAPTILARVYSDRVQAIDAPLLTNGIHQIYRDRGGTLWINSEGKLYRLNGTQMSAIPGPPELPAGEMKIRGIAMDNSGMLWVSVISDGPDLIYRLRNKVWDRFHGLDSIHSLAVTSMLADQSGRLWIATSTSRIFLVDNNKVLTFEHKQGVDSGGATLLQEKGDHVWIGGAENLDYFAQGKFRRISFDDGSSISGVTGVAETGNGDVWFYYDRGILKVQASVMRQALLEDRPRVQGSTLNYLDGDFETPIIRVQSHTVAQPMGDRLYFLGRQGLVWIDPLHVDTNEIRPGVFVTVVNSDGQIYNDPSAIDLARGSQNLQINYTATSLLIPARVTFRYKLDGFDKDWQDVGTRRQAFYTHLPPGNYSFLVMARNNDGLWSAQAAHLHLNLPPTFLQSYWFRLLCVAAALGILSLIFLFRMRSITARMQQRLVERLAERERIARDLHDTFFQGIQGLFLRFNTGTAMLPANEPARVIFLNALEQSDRVMAEGRELVLDLRADETVTASLAEDLARVEAQTFGGAQPAYGVFAVGQARRLHPVCSSELLRIGLEAVHNAFKHANAKAVEVEIIYERDSLKMRIRDDGRGIDEDVLREGHRPGHLGLVGMNERAARIGARYSLWSKRGQGTEIEVEVPAKIAYGTQKASRWNNRQ